MSDKYINAQELKKELAWLSFHTDKIDFKTRVFVCEVIEKIKPVEMLDRDVGIEPRLEDKTSVIHSDFADGTAETVVKDYKAWTCPKCGKNVGEVYCENGRWHIQREVSYCSSCGQKIDWTKPMEEEKRWKKCKKQKG